MYSDLFGYVRAGVGVSSYHAEKRIGGGGWNRECGVEL